MGNWISVPSVPLVEAHREAILKARVCGQPLKPFLVRPIHKADYFEHRQPFNVIAFLKTPYGMMIGACPFTVEELSLRVCLCLNNIDCSIEFVSGLSSG